MKLIDLFLGQPDWLMFIEIVLTYLASSFPLFIKFTARCAAPRLPTEGDYVVGAICWFAWPIVLLCVGVCKIGSPVFGKIRSACIAETRRQNKKANPGAY